MGTLSGKSWVDKFPNSSSLDDLREPFRTQAKSFVAALRKAGAMVEISSTYRPPERAYLMHYSFQVANNSLDPSTVPPMKGVDIDWNYKDPTGKTDLAASRKAARDMVAAYEIVFAPALSSRHTERNAVDMDISWAGDLTIAAFDGKGTTTIRLEPRTGANKDLQTLGASYSVHKLVTDPPHWSSDGH
jgi:hypothetical protein